MFLAGALVFLSQSRDVVLSASALFALAVGMSTPLLLLGASAGAWLPRSGAWMNAVKRSFGLILLGYILLINVAHNSINAVQPSFFTELFGPRVRYSGASIGAQLGAIVAGGFTPFIARALTAINNESWTLVPAYVVVACLVSAAAAYFGPETSRRDMTAEPAPDQGGRLPQAA